MSNAKYISMSLESTKSTRFQFRAKMKKGKIFERKIQDEITKWSYADVFNNVQVGNICEFDVVVADYPILTFIEIKAYRRNMKPERARYAISKLRKKCINATKENLKWNRYWTPCLSDKTEAGFVTNKELLFKKLGYDMIEGWRYRMMLIVPDISYEVVVKALTGEFMIRSTNKCPKNVIDIEGIPLIVIPAKKIKDVFS